jgi:hypothetical protein
MAPSAPSPRIGRGSVDAALTLKSQISCPEDSRPARTSPLARESTLAAGSPQETPEIVARADALEAKWQSAIDAATD